jgi:hypothetical protein
MAAYPNFLFMNGTKAVADVGQMCFDFNTYGGLEGFWYTFQPPWGNGNTGYAGSSGSICVNTSGSAGGAMFIDGAYVSISPSEDEQIYFDHTETNTLLRITRVLAQRSLNVIFPNLELLIVTYLSSTDTQIPLGVYPAMMTNSLVDTRTFMGTVFLILISRTATASTMRDMPQARATSMPSSSKVCSLPTITVSGNTAPKIALSQPATASSVQLVYSWRL